MRAYLESRPLLLFASAFVAGIAAGPVAAAGAVILIILRSRRPLTYAVLLAGALAGWLRGLSPEPPEIREMQTTIRGRVIDEPVRHGPRISFTARAEIGLVRVHRTGPVGDVLRGDVVEVAGYLAPPKAPTNPGQPDFAARLRRDGIFAVLRSYERHEIRVTPGGHLLRPVDRLRAALRDSFEAHADADTAGLLSALVLGYRERLPQDLVTRLKRSGTAHFLAISGLHLGLVFGLFLALALLTGLRGRAQITTVLAALFAYTLLTGMNVAVLRAFIMIAVFLVGRLLRRRRDPLTSLATAALLLSAWDPAGVHEVSFHLSFLAVLGIFWMAPIFHDFLASPHRIKALFAVSLSAWLATAPVIQRTFHIVTPVVILANVIFWPFVALLIALGLLMCALSWTPLAGLIGEAAALLVAGMRGISAGTDALAPLTYFYSPGAGPLLLAAYYLLLAGWATWCRAAPSPRRALLCGLIAGLLALPLLHRERTDHPLVAQLDVGRGLCTYVELPDGRNFVFDVGSLDYRDPGASVLGPYLWSRGVRQVDTVFVSHDDADHSNGLRTLVEQFAVRRIVTTPYAELPPLPEGVAVERVRVKGDGPLRLSEEIEILSPPVWEEAGRPVGSNETSLVLRFAGRLLLTGDIMEQAVERLLGRSWDLTAEVVAAPHHGKRADLYRELVRRTGARFLLVSAPEGYYAMETVETFSGDAYVTGKVGAVEVTLADPVRVRTWVDRGRGLPTGGIEPRKD